MTGPGRAEQGGEGTSRWRGTVGLRSGEGVSSSQVLQSATSIPADRLGSNTGKIMQGKKANLVLLEQNPLENIANTRKINTVFLNGRILDRTLLDRILESVKTANNSSRKKDISQFLNY